jgi:hypothetical protein
MVPLRVVLFVSCWAFVFATQKLTQQFVWVPKTICAEHLFLKSTGLGLSTNLRRNRKYTHIRAGFVFVHAPVLDWARICAEQQYLILFDYPKRRTRRNELDWEQIRAEQNVWLCLTTQNSVRAEQKLNWTQTVHKFGSDWTRTDHVSDGETNNQKQKTHFSQKNLVITKLSPLAERFPFGIASAHPPNSNQGIIVGWSWNYHGNILACSWKYHGIIMELSSNDHGMIIVHGIVTEWSGNDHGISMELSIIVCSCNDHWIIIE